MPTALAFLRAINLGAKRKFPRARSSPPAGWKLERQGKQAESDSLMTFTAKPSPNTKQQNQQARRHHGVSVGYSITDPLVGNGLRPT